MRRGGSRVFLSAFAAGFSEYKYLLLKLFIVRLLSETLLYVV